MKMPFATCTSCGKSSRRAKLLKCLHSICVCCLSKHVTESNEVICPVCRKLTPSSGEGKPQLLALPDSYVTAGGHGAEETQQVGEELEDTVHCDECFEEEKAVSTCSDCKAVLCELHAQSHSRSRSTHNHKVEPLARGPCTADSLNTEPPLQPRMYCIIHASHKLGSFCTTCNHFFCEQCLLRGGVCKDASVTSHSLLPVREAADKMRGSLLELLASSTATDQQGVVLKAIENLKAAIGDLHDRTEAVSQEVMEYFVGIAKLMKSREAEMLDKLDSLRSAKLLPMEQQKRHLEESLSSKKTVSRLLESCDDDYDLIRMSGWLREAATAADETARKVIKPSLDSRLAFQQLDNDQLTAAITCVGLVYDAADIDPTQSGMDCRRSVDITEEMCIKITPVSGCGTPVHAADISMTILEVEVMSPDNKAVPCETNTSGEGDDIVVATFQPTKSGKHQVVARYDGRRFSACPLDVIVSSSQFDPSRCQRNIQLSNNNRTARLMEGGWRSVCGVDIYTTGTYDMSIRLDKIPEPHLLVLMCSSPNPPLDNIQQDNSAFGWYGGDTSSGTWRGTRLGQPWQTGDVIHLSLDCDRHTLTGRHERTGIAQTLSNVIGNFYFYVTLNALGHQMTILDTKHKA